MFGFRITYLRNSVTASDVSTGQSKTAVEWPPHPDRLFCALVNAWASLGMPGDGEKALRWLEKCGPPKISCGRALMHDIYVKYVPVNDDFARIGPPIHGTPLYRLRQPRLIPSAPLSDDRVIFWYEKENPDSEIRDALRKLANQVARLGHSSSFVMVELIDAFETVENVFVPSPMAGDHMIRVPYPGRLDEILFAFKNGAGRPPLCARWVNYGRELEESREVPVKGSHNEMLMFKLEGEKKRRLSILHTASVIDCWRRKILSAAGPKPIPIITGHSEESTPEYPAPLKRPYMALLPLPDVGHRFARSHLLGLAAALPTEISPADRETCLRVLASVKNLEFGEWGNFRLNFCGAYEPQQALRVDVWKRSSKVWGSVTPVVLGRYPKEPWSKETKDIIKESCRIAGLPEPVEVHVAPISWVLGAPASFDFPPLPNRHGKGHRFHVHAKLVFDVPVEGPVLVGVGRHRGYGLFRQLWEEEYET